jgi:hypothetical protein
MIKFSEKIAVIDFFHNTLCLMHVGNKEKKEGRKKKKLEHTFLFIYHLLIARRDPG